jgi:hypothetical protein
MVILSPNLRILPGNKYANYYVTIKTYFKQSTHQSSNVNLFFIQKSAQLII